MIERLMEEETRYGEPVYTTVSEEIDTAHQALETCLDNAGRAVLDQLEDAYIRREDAVRHGAFRAGFRAALALMRELDPADEHPRHGNFAEKRPAPASV